MFTRREVHTEMTTRGETRVHTVECTQGGVYAQEEDSNREIHISIIYHMTTYYLRQATENVINNINFHISRQQNLE